MERVLSTGKAFVGLKRLMIAMMAFVAMAATAGDGAKVGEWQLEKEEDGVQIYARSVEGWEIREILAVTTLSTTPGSVLAVLNDVEENAPKLSDVVRNSAIEQRESATRYRIYTVMDMPWPLSDRDSFNQRVIEHDADSGVVTITDTATQGIKPEQEDLVRIQASRQQWRLTPLEDGQTKVELQILVDPNGPIPSSLINSMSVGQPIGTMETLKKLVQQPEYRDAELVVAQES
ncbi:hypothetical protein I6N98_13010 [Spongiibacter nanhainus]|uniref:START domain-containing protein n=1 Tax=Spongiibacter nanhainus TaxID=2794344 RepID=A0A7T4QYS1_9GAMM|nr:START domain-containing protein [Spongiibacter nanhainus]QQD17280.1 hypothetical protein I6N98_13010 [Spongiibacter nanhainus]